MHYHKSALLNISLPLLLAALVLATSAAAPAAAESACSEATSSAEFWGVGVFYYVWYGSPGTDGSYMHWNHSVLPHWNAQVQAKHAGVSDNRANIASVRRHTLNRSRRRLYSAV
jgi:hypothetical protein